MPFPADDSGESVEGPEEPIPFTPPNGSTMTGPVTQFRCTDRIGDTITISRNEVSKKLESADEDFH
jgi:hypothetical protein